VAGPGPATQANRAAIAADTNANLSDTRHTVPNPPRNKSSLENPIMQPATRRRAAARACATLVPNLAKPSTGHAPQPSEQRAPKGQPRQPKHVPPAKRANSGKKKGRRTHAPLIPGKGPPGEYSEILAITDYRRKGKFFGRKCEAIVEVKWANGKIRWIYVTWLGITLLEFNAWMSRILAQAERLPATFKNESGSLLGHPTPELIPELYGTNEESDSDSDSDSDDEGF
jgi:hypothetical protein